MHSFGRISTSLFTILMLQFKASDGQQRAFFTVAVGDEVTLPSGNVRTENHNCDGITWNFKHTGRKTVTWFGQGIFTKEAKAKSGKLSVTANCSLVIKNVTADDFGYYCCRRKTTDQKFSLIKVDLNVVTMTEHRNEEEVTFRCSVSVYTVCKHLVVWLYEGKENISPDKNMSTSCAAAVTVPMSYLHQNSKFYELLKCKVKEAYNKKDYLFTFSHQTSGKKTVEEMMDCLHALVT
ncbi:uncharacterized protein LOC119795876 [Cyprinodon tularosa]|uniref:uncharacterized protein LOC119795876 n=1 Tax=Cyprinodon tularosa TaxID=77115 RepID=UPI0018E1FCE0|nr:uncharacterized protein LOC119795876 [Cyprinodon tularosa]